MPNAPYIDAAYRLELGAIPPSLSLQTGAGGAVVPIAPGGRGTPVIAAPGIFRPGAAGARAVSSFITQNPVTGNLVWYKNRGQPVLFSGDLAAARRVRKIATKVRTAAGIRHHHHRPVRRRS